MTTKTLDITGKVCPFCLLETKKVLDGLQPGDVLEVSCDHPPAATITIPRFAEMGGMPVEVKKISSGLWEISITKK